MRHRRIETQVLIVGAGPAGMAAAWEASRAGKRVVVIDDNAVAGGQIWRGGGGKSAGAREWMERWRGLEIVRLQQMRVIGAEAERRTLLTEGQGGDSADIVYETLILATGAREVFMPFRGWTLPGVAGAGGLQALMKAGMEVRGKRLVLAGSGPLLLAVAELARERGARVSLIAEQAPAASIRRFALGLAAMPSKLVQAAVMRMKLLGVPYRTSCMVEKVEEAGGVLRAELVQGERRWLEECDIVGTGFGLRANTELAELMGCGVVERAVVVDRDQRTTVEGVFCVGEACGVGGVEKAVAEGRIAGLQAAGRKAEAAALYGERDRQRRFAAALARAFVLRPAVRDVVRPETTVCRCEDVTAGELEGYENWRDLKLQTRCGMGPCQGRVCGPAVEELRGWRPAGVRPPLFPARVSSLAHDLEDSQ